MRTTRKLLALLLAVAMVFTMTAMTALATGGDGGTTTPDSGPTTPGGDPTTPDDGTTTPGGGTTTPGGDTTPGGGTTPAGGTTTPGGGPATPDDPTTPGDPATPEVSAEAKAVIALIEALPTSEEIQEAMTADTFDVEAYKAQVSAALAAYDALPEEQKAGVTNIANLTQAEADLVLLESISPLGDGGVCQIVGGGKYQTLEEAVEKVQDGGTIKMLTDVELTETVTISGGKNITLDLNGVKISSKVSRSFTVTGSGTSLKVDDTSTEKKGEISLIHLQSAYSARVIDVTSSASFTLAGGAITIVEGVKATAVYTANGTTFTMTGGSISTKDGDWTNTSGINYGTKLIQDGKIYGPTSINTKFVDVNKKIVRGTDGGITVADTAPTDFHVNYGDRFYDCYGTIQDAATGMYNAYKDNDVATVTINEDGSGGVPTITLNSGQSFHFVLNEGATLRTEKGTIKLAEGSKITVKGPGTVQDGVFAASTSTMELKITKDESTDITTYEPIHPDYFQVGEIKYNKIEDAIADAEKAQDHTVKLLRNARQDTFTVSKGSTVIFDLGGYTLELDGSSTITDSEVEDSANAKVTAAVVNHGNLTIQNGTLEVVGGKKDGIVNVGTLTIASNATVKLTYDTNDYRYVVVNRGGIVNSSGTLISAVSNGMATFGGTVDITGGEIQADGTKSAGGIHIFNRAYDNSSQGAVVTISGGSIKSKLYSVATNGSRSGGETPSSLTVTGGTLTSEYSTIYWPAGNLTIGTQGSTTGPSLSATNGSAIEICGGSLHVYGGNLSGASGSPTGQTDEALLEAFRDQNGAGNLGDAIAIIARRAIGYPDTLTVSIEGGTFSSSNDYALRYMDCNLASGATQIDKKVDVSVSNGTFNGKIAAVDASFVEESDRSFITGGKFSSDVKEYVADQHDQLVTNNETDTPFWVGWYTDRGAADAMGQTVYKVTYQFENESVDVYYMTEEAAKDAIEEAKKENPSIEIPDPVAVKPTPSGGSGGSGSYRPVILSPVRNQTVSVIEHGTLTMSVRASWASSYQWYVDRGDGRFVAIAGATGASLTIWPDMGDNGNRYYCRATNGYGGVNSPYFTLCVVRSTLPPKTGDQVSVTLWVCLMALGVAGVLTAWNRQRNR